MVSYFKGLINDCEMVGYQKNYIQTLKVIDVEQLSLSKDNFVKTKPEFSK